MSSWHDTSTTESVCSSNCTIDSVSQNLPSNLSFSDDSQPSDYFKFIASVDDSATYSQIFHQRLYVGPPSAKWKFPWTTANDRTATEIDFGSLLKDYGQPLIIHFYNDLCGNPVSRIGDFQDVSLTEAVKALNAQSACTKSVNLVVRIDCCSESGVATVLPVLRLLLFRCRMNFSRTEWERCVLQMADYEFSDRVVELLADFAHRVLELNIGSAQFVRQQRRRNILSEEANYVFQLLRIWVQRCYSTIRCLRIFAFVRIDARLSSMLNRCLILTHLTISRIADVSYSRFDTIESLEINGCGMGYTDNDLEICKSLTKYFPSVHVIGFHEICFDPVFTTLIRSLTSTALRFKIYQIVCIQQISSLMKPMFILRSPYKEDDESVELVSPRYGTRLIVYDNRSIYRTPL